MRWIGYILICCLGYSCSTSETSGSLIGVWKFNSSDVVTEVYHLKEDSTVVMYTAEVYGGCDTFWQSREGEWKLGRSGGHRAICFMDSTSQRDCLEIEDVKENTFDIILPVSNTIQQARRLPDDYMEGKLPSPSEQIQYEMAANLAAAYAAYKNYAGQLDEYRATHQSGHSANDAFMEQTNTVLAESNALIEQLIESTGNERSEDLCFTQMKDLEEVTVVRHLLTTRVNSKDSTVVSPVLGLQNHVIDYIHQVANERTGIPEHYYAPLNMEPMYFVDDSMESWTGWWFEEFQGATAAYSLTKLFELNARIIRFELKVLALEEVDIDEPM